MGTNVSDELKRQIAGWLEDGLKLSQVQSRLSEAGVKMTYMDLKFLLADLELKPKDAEPAPEPPAEIKKDAGAETSPASKTSNAEAPAAKPDPEPAPAGGSISLSVDQITKPGTIVSGKVKFSDGVNAEWFLDQMGRLGLTGPEKTYRPPEGDIPEFQRQLQGELAKLGF